VDFSHPTSGLAIPIESPLPAELADFLAGLERT
jgi:hypothetical protein